MQGTMLILSCIDAAVAGRNFEQIILNKRVNVFEQLNNAEHLIIEKNSCCQ